MQDKPSVLIVIPARKGSSFRGKNIYPFLNRKLIHYTFDASNIETPHDTVVTTNDIEVKAEAELFRFMTHDRKAWQANDNATLDTVMTEIAKVYPDYSTYILLPPTAPLRKKGHVQEAYNTFIKEHADSLLSVTSELKSIWKIGERGFARPIVERNRNRQTVEPVFIANGAIFIMKKESIIATGHKVAGRVSLYRMEQQHSVDVHSKEDIELAEYYIQKGY